MAKQKVGKTYKTSKFSSTKGFDRNQPTLSRIVNRLNDAVRNTGPVVEVSIDSSLLTFLKYGIVRSYLS